MQILFELLGHDELSEITPTPKKRNSGSGDIFLNIKYIKKQTAI